MAGLPPAPKGAPASVRIGVKGSPPPAAPKPPQMAGPGVPLNSPLLNPNATLSGKPLYQAAVNLANAQYNPSISALQAQGQQNNQQAQNAEGQTNSYFSNLGQFVNQSNQQLGQIGSGLNSQLQTNAANTAKALQDIGANATSSLLAYAPQAYGNNSLAAPALSSLQTELARQQGLSAQANNAFQNYGATQGANYESLGASNLGSYAMRGQEDLANIAQGAQVKNEPIMNKIAALQQSRGALIGTDLGKLRQQEIANQISQAGLGIKQATLSNTVANDKATQANNTAKVNATIRGQNIAQQTTERGQNITQAKNQFDTNPNAVGSPAWTAVQKQTGTQWSNNPSAVGSPAWARAQKAQTSGANGTAKPLSTNENNVFWGKVGTIEQLIKDGQTKGGTGAQIRDGLTTGNNPTKTKFDQFMVTVAWALVGWNGMITPGMAATLHNQYGVRGGTFNGQPVRIGNPPKTQTPAQGFQNTLSAIGSTVS